MNPRLSFRRALPGAFILAFVGCNAVLDNERAELGSVGEETSPTLPDEPTADAGTPPEADAGEEDTSDPCGPGMRTCNGTCVSVTDPAYGCGTCTPCSIPRGTAACQAGKCVLHACDTGYGDCNQDVADGCEADLSQPTTCGGCGGACPPASPVCVASGATYACSNGCGPASPMRCGDTCVNPLTSIKHCGGCGNECPPVADATATCTNGVCGFECKAPRKACNGKCVKPKDPEACGPTCAPCPALPNATASCPADACVYQCTAGFADCNAIAADGCEANLASDPAHCGACGIACAAGTVCRLGACVAP